MLHAPKYSLIRSASCVTPESPIRRKPSRQVSSQSLLPQFLLPFLRGQLQTATFNSIHLYIQIVFEFPEFPRR